MSKYKIWSADLLHSFSQTITRSESYIFIWTALTPWSQYTQQVWVCSFVCWLTFTTPPLTGRDSSSRANMALSHKLAWPENQDHIIKWIVSWRPCGYEACDRHIIWQVHGVNSQQCDSPKLTPPCFVVCALGTWRRIYPTPAMHICPSLIYSLYGAFSPVIQVNDFLWLPRIPDAV